MPRKARIKSQTGIYHVILRGINRQIIFEDCEDYQKYLDLLKDYQEISGYKIYAYCLMNNHLHLLIMEGEEDLGNIFKRMGSSYVYWYNWKYNRSGHLFQDRFKSEPVEDDAYFLTILRYIHQNPLKAGAVVELGDYPWSSYHEYQGKRELCETGFALKMFSENQGEAQKLFAVFNQQKYDTQFLDIDEKKRWKDSEALDLIRELGGVKSPIEIQKMEKAKRDELIRNCKSRGLSIRQIERLTGISFGIIRRISG